MGHTQYWTFKPGYDQEAYTVALTEIRKLIRASPVPLGDGMGEGEPFMGQGGVSFNGREPDTCENFYLKPRPAVTPDDWDGLGGGPGFHFAKTRELPYDLIVAACLCVLAERLGDGVFVVGGNGLEGFVDGAVFASKTLGRDVPLPPDPDGDD